MKNYIKPISNIMPINIHENIASSGSDYWDIHHNKEIIAEFDSHEEFIEYLRKLME